MTARPPKKVWYLRRLDLLAGLTDAQIEELARLLDDHRFPAGVELLAHRDRDQVFLIKEGAVRLYAATPRGELTLALLGVGRLFGLSALVGEARPPVGARTLVPAYVCVTTWPRLMEVLVAHPAVLLRVLEAVGEQLVHAEVWLERVHAAPPRTRLARLLLELAAEFGETGDGGRRIPYRLTQADLGRMVGLSRETVSRVLAEFRQAGWVSRTEGRLVVRDAAALDGIAEGRPAAES